MAHPWPPEVSGNKFHHLPSARVASDWVVVVGFHYVQPELTISDDVDLSSVE